MSTNWKHFSVAALPSFPDAIQRHHTLTCQFQLPNGCSLWCDKRASNSSFFLLHCNISLCNSVTDFKWNLFSYSSQAGHSPCTGFYYSSFTNEKWWYRRERKYKSNFRVKCQNITQQENLNAEQQMNLPFINVWINTTSNILEQHFAMLNTCKNNAPECMSEGDVS